MISSTVRLQLLAFVVVTVLGVGYVSVRYLDAGALLGTGPYPVTLQLTDSGGIFTGADAAVTNLSAIGEQFVDLRPVRADGPKLAAGSVIPASRVSTPVAVEDLPATPSRPCPRP